MASIQIIAERRQLRREEAERKLSNIANRLGVELEPIEQDHFSIRADAIVQEYAKTRQHAQLVEIIAALVARIEALESASKLAGGAKRAK